MFANPLEAFAKNEIDKVETKLKAIDENHNGLSDLVEVEQKFTSGFAKLRAVEEELKAKVPPAELLKVLTALFPGVLSATTLANAEAGIAEIVEGAETLAVLAKVAPKAI